MPPEKCRCSKLGFHARAVSTPGSLPAVFLRGQCTFLHLADQGWGFSCLSQSHCPHPSPCPPPPGMRTGRWVVHGAAMEQAMDKCLSGTVAYPVRKGTAIPVQDLWLFYKRIWCVCFYTHFLSFPFNLISIFCGTDTRNNKMQQ